MLGNLLDNACKWARSRVTVRSEAAATASVAIRVDDDGPGLAPELRTEVLQSRRPGRRAGARVWTGSRDCA